MRAVTNELLGEIEIVDLLHALGERLVGLVFGTSDAMLLSELIETRAARQIGFLEVVVKKIR